jgi:hypothetical protein
MNSIFAMQVAPGLIWTNAIVLSKSYAIFQSEGV